MEELYVEHLSNSHMLLASLFRDVINSEFLQRQLLEGNTEFEYAFIDATMIVSRVHALATAFRAINDMLEGRLKSRNVHSEMVFCLSPNNNISESFRRFGISPTTTSLLVLKLSAPARPFSAAAVQTHLTSNIKGRQVPFTDGQLREITDWKGIRKIYKLPPPLSLGADPKGKGAINGDTEIDELQEAEAMIVGAMALRGVA